jgi:hypothetical protein
MPVKAIIPSIGTVIIEGAAEEATMRQLLAVLGKQPSGTSGKTGSGSGSGIPPGGGNTNTADSKNLQERMEKGAKAEERFTDVMNGSVEVLQKSANNFSRSFSNATPSVKDFSGVLADFAPEPFASAINAFGGTLSDQIEIFRHLSQSGIDLGDSLLTAQLKAGEARLPLEIFAKTIKENSTSLSMAFGSASQGADKFAAIQGKFMEKSGQKFAALGFSMDELATYNASYMEQLNRSGKLRSMSDAEVAAGAEKYNQELDKMAKATGVSRQQLDEANKATQRDARMKLALSKLDEGQQTAVNAKIAQLNQMDPSGQLAAGFKDLIAGGGVALTKEARNFTMTMSAAGVDAGKMTRDISKGQAGAIEQMNAGFYKAGKAGEQLSEGQRTLAMATATMGNTIPALGLAQMAGMQDTNAAIDKARKEQAEKEAAAKTDPTRAVAGLDQTLTDVQNSLKKSLIETKIFETTANGLKFATDQAKALGDSFAKMSTVEKIGTFIAPEAAKAIGSYIKDLGITALQTLAGAKAAGMAYDAYKDSKKGKEPLPTEPDGKKPGSPGKPGTAEKIGKEAAEEIGEKPSWWSKIGAAMKRNKWYLAGTAAAGGLIYFHEELTDLVLPDATKFIANKMTANMNLPAGMNTAGANNQQNNQTQASAQNQTGQMNREVAELNTALKSTDFSRLVIPESVGTSIDQSVIKLKTLKDTISTTTSAFRDLNNVNLTTLNESINKLNSTVEKQGAQPKAEKVSAIVPQGAEKEMVALLNQLNTNMGQMVSQQSDAVDFLSKTAKYTRQTSNNSA